MKILFLVHGFPPEDLGGTELHAYDLARSLVRRGHGLHVFARIGNPSAPEYQIGDSRLDGIEVRRIVNNQTRRTDRPDRNPVIRDKFLEYFNHLRPDIVHVHHLLALSSDIPAAVTAAGIPYLVTAHDYWYGCDRIQLRRPDGSVCDCVCPGEICARHCRRDHAARAASGYTLAAMARKLGTDTLPRRMWRTMRTAFKPSPPPHEIEFWRNRVADGLAVPRQAAAVIVPSRHVAQRLADWGVAADKLRILPHGIIAPRHIHPLPDKPVIAYLGAIERHKGIHVLIESIKRLAPETSLEIWGRGTDQAYLAELQKQASPLAERVVFKGKYHPDDLDRIMAGVAVVAVPSLWEETFCYVAREAQARGRPAVVSRLGALTEAVVEGQTGFTAVPDDAAALSQALKRALSPDMRQTFTRDLPQRFKTIDDYTEKIENLYQVIMAETEKS